MPRIMFVGDISLGEYYTSFGHGPRTYLENNNVFEKVQDIFSQADMVVGNLEAPLTNANFDPKEPESMVLRGDPKHASLLYQAGFRVLQVANNHTVQHGQEGFDETVKVLEASGIKAIGLKDQGLTVITVKGESVGFLAASDVPDNTDKSQTSYQPLDQTFTERVLASVDKVDHLFVLLHWGLEASTSPLPYQREYIEELYRAGVRGVIGSHPHLFYEIWRKSNFIAAPSLGDFVFDLGWDERLLQSGILDVSFHKILLDANVWPVHLEHNGCLPSPREPLKLKESITLYHLGDNMNGELPRKLLYFLKNFHLGNTKLKIKFFMRKLFPTTRR